MVTKMQFRTQLIEAVEGIDWAEGFARWLSERGLGPKSIEAYLADTRVFGRFYVEANGQAFQPELLTSLDLREFRTWSLDVQQVSPATWNRRMVSLAGLCKWAHESGLVNYNPFQGVTRMEQVELAPRWLDKQEFARFMRQVERNVQAARTDYAKRQALRDQAMIGLMAYAGLREGEVSELAVMDVELRERSGCVTVRMGKGEKRREVPLGKEARRAMEMWLNLLGTERPSERLFTGKGNVPIGARGIQKMVDGIAEACGVEATPHQLRHTFAKRMLDKGTPLTVISKLLGHAKLETTARYVQPGRGDLEKAVEDL